jgi:superfamily II DNA/RNA helicase
MSKRTRSAGVDDDPLDAAGALGANPLTGRPYSEARMKWAGKWSTFPLYADKPKLRSLVASIRDNQVTIVISGTGSGKTVLAVPLVLRHVLANDTLIPPTRASSVAAAETGNVPAPPLRPRHRSRRVAVTIPKRILVQAAAATGAMTLDVEVGQEVGYQHRGSLPAFFSAERTRLVYATDGTLLAQARKDPMLSDYAAVVIDEAHERPVPTDMLLLALRGALVARPDLRLLVMSATMDPKPFVDYFSALKTHVVEISGAANYPIEVRHEPPSSPTALAIDPLKAGLEAVGRIEAAIPPPAPLGILMFVPTTKDATTGCRKLLPKGGVIGGLAPLSCAPLYGKMTDEAKDAVLGAQARKERPPRMLFVATNVAESSLTVDGITHVVDTGMQLTNRWDSAVHGSVIDRGMASRAQITQRIGRTGRTAPGVAVLLYPKSTFDALPLYPPPAILTVDITEPALSALARRPSGPTAPPLTLAGVFAELGTLITPPTKDQFDGAASFLEFYGLAAVPPAVPGLAAVVPGLVPHPSPLPPLPPPQAVGGGRGRRKPPVQKKKEAAPDEATKHSPATKPLEKMTITPFGRWVQRACDELKLSAWHALLPCIAAAAYRRCARDAVDLALVFEACGGELGSLVLPSDRDGANQKQQKQKTLEAFLDRGSEHLSILRVLREFVRPMIDGEKEKAADRVEGGGATKSPSTKRRATNDALVRAGLQPSAWRSVVDKLRRDGGRAMRFFALATAELSPMSLPALLRPPPDGHHPPDERTLLVSALSAARLYHLVGGSHTVFPARKVAVDFEPMFGGSRGGDKDATTALFCVCEQLTATSSGSSARWRTSCVTRIPLRDDIPSIKKNPAPKIDARDKDGRRRKGPKRGAIKGSASAAQG